MAKFYIKGVDINDDYLLNLTGIRALHAADEEASTLTYEVIPDEHTDELVVISMKSKYFKLFNVLIDMRYKKLDNQQIISSGLDRRVSERCLKAQVEFAIRENFTHINITATRIDRITKVFNTPLIGYKVFGKYGYQMLGSDDVAEFIEMMQAKNLNVEAIHQIYGEGWHAEQARKVWEVEGDTWLGRFNLKPTSLSCQILAAL